MWGALTGGGWDLWMGLDTPRGVWGALTGGGWDLWMGLDTPRSFLARLLDHRGPGCSAARPPKGRPSWSRTPDRLQP
ncbi:hypothetical protein NOCA1170002 [metagenome]|uniref:Uncharacterized protein n=1 Tax=metagenome TaxID=256318 RepID=A0A2P2CAH6_9ZZZZ